MNEYISRLIEPHITDAHKYYQVIVVCGPRQSGKTRMCRHLYPGYKYVNLEDITLRAAAIADPTKFLESLGDKAIIDEVQNVAELLSLIQVVVDNDPNRRYILTGSCKFSLLSTITQSLAGRAAIFTLLPFSLKEIGDLEKFQRKTDDAIVSGMYPGVIAKDIPQTLFYRNYYNTYVERDLRDLLKIKNLIAFDKFMRLIASRIGSEFNASTLAREVGVSSVTIAEWLSILTTSYVAFPLRPYFTNVSKQMTKMPKIYFYDTGLACFLLGIESAEQLKEHQMRGALFENLAMEELIKKQYNAGKECRINFYRERTGIEVDAIVTDGLNMDMYEIKSSETYKTEYAHNMQKAAQNIGNIENSSVIYNGQTIKPIAINIWDI